ncbi:hypothetical protein AMECASPLE_034949 [Ameca splendens]|uniref:Uncharacterized protein n=1 Tax=Ameca splendens TaxID=208324 RepID=A0ABV0YVW4_9TELE
MYILHACCIKSIRISTTLGEVIRDIELGRNKPKNNVDFPLRRITAFILLFLDSSTQIPDQGSPTPFLQNHCPATFRCILSATHLNQMSEFINQHSVIYFCRGLVLEDVSVW